MFKAKVFYTIGCGLKIGYLSADSYSELAEKVARVEETNLIIEKVVFSYPSGKSYVKKY